MIENKKHSWILYLGTFPPRECGIATFTKDLTGAIDRKFSPKIKSKVLAMNEGINIYNYPNNVIFQINDTDIQEYIDTAKKINETDNIKLVSIQHEFGIFGGERGDYLIPFLDILNKPAVVTLHTVLPNPGDKLKKVVQSIARNATCLVVMVKSAVEILRKDYEIEKDIFVIPHGIPIVPFSPSIKEKTKMGYGDKILLSSFGMVNSKKGYEYVIDALPEVIKKFSNVLYLIIGETHPVIRKKEGEAYRNFLENKVQELGLQNHVRFYNKYVTLNEIIKYLKATDIYLSSALNPDQITSGTLSYSMGCGKAVVSTPFLHAKEALAQERGILVEFKNSKSIANAILKILSDTSLKKNIEENAYSYMRPMTWPNVALAYMDLFEKYLDIKYEKTLPSIKLSHLTTLTDTFGIIQFAKNTKPDINSGYTLDDNAKAMLVCCMHYDTFKDDTRLNSIKNSIEIYLNFIKHIHHRDGKLYNFVDYNKKVNYEHWSEDAHGRALWALGYLISCKSIPRKLKNEAEQIFNNALNVTENIKSPRAVAFTILGLYFYNNANPSPENIFRIKKLADHLVSLYNDSSSDDWQWFEEYLTYSNSKLSEALFYAYLATKDKKYLRVAMSTLDFLILITFEDDMFVPIGHRGWYIKDKHRAYFDQQPVETASIVQTLTLAYKVTKRDEYKERAITAFLWFLGDNYLNQVIYDETTGGCHDGLGEDSINLNQGAESTVCYLLARLSLV